MTAGEFIGTLLHAVTQGHILHLREKSYARHVALGELYEGLGDAVDTLAECYQGLEGIQQYPDTFGEVPKDAVQFAQSLGMFIAENREVMGKESTIQNLVDEVNAIVLQAIYKLENLS